MFVELYLCYKSIVIFLSDVFEEFKVLSLEGGENLMKKLIALVLSLMLLVVFSIGCKPAETPKPEAPAPAPAEQAAPAPAPEKPAEAPAPAPAPEKPAH